VTFGGKKYMNYRCIKHDLVEARDQLNQIIAKFDAESKSSEGEFLVMLQHAFRHLNKAWNARRTSLTSYRHISRIDFNRWAKFPHGREWDKMNRTRRSTPTAHKVRRG